MLHRGATGKWIRPVRWRTSELKHGCCVISSAITTSLYIAVANLGCFLLVFEQRVDDAIKKRLRPAVAEMQNALSPDSVVNGESDAYQGDAEIARDSITFAVADHQVRFEQLCLLGDGHEIGAITDFQRLGQICRNSCRY